MANPPRDQQTPENEDPDLDQDESDLPDETLAIEPIVEEVDESEFAQARTKQTRPLLRTIRCGGIWQKSAAIPSSARKKNCGWFMTSKRLATATRR